MLGWIRPGWEPRATAVAADEVKDLTSLAAWLAKGFALLVALLGFFGIKEDVLDRALDQYPHPALLVFAQVGGAVVAAAAVAVLPAKALLRAPFLAVAIVGVVLLIFDVVAGAPAGAVAAVLAAAMLAVLWVVLPLVVRSRHTGD